MPEFYLMSKRFLAGPLRYMDEYAGGAIAAKDGVYLLFSRRQLGQKVLEWQSKAATLAHSIGLKSQQLARKDAKALGSDAFWRGNYQDIPIETVSHPDWPTLREIGDVWFVHRDRIDEVKLSIWYGVRLRMNEARFHVMIGMFDQLRARRVLREMSWVK